MLEFMREVISRTVTGFGERAAAFGPNLLAMLVLLLAGALVAGAAHVLLRALLPLLGFDRFAQRLGLTTVLRKGGVARPASAVLAVGSAWTLLSMFVLLAIAALDLRFAMDLVSRALGHLPQILLAGALLVLGALVSAFVRRSVLIAAVNAGLPSARVLAGAAHAALLSLFAAMALEHLGVGRQIILASFTLAFGGVVFALALAFGLAGRDLARDFLERVLRGAGSDAHEDARRHL